MDDPILTGPELRRRRIAAGYGFDQFADLLNISPQ